MTAIEGGDPLRRPRRASRRRPASQALADRAAATAPISLVPLALCVIAIAVGIAASLGYFLHRGSLWEDELIAITHENQPLPLFFIEVLRNDIHPPLYFLQLDAWLALGPATDRWALGNSLLWAAIGLATMFHVARTLHGVRAAWVATALLAVLPSFIWSAATLRMYAALPACVLFVYYANRRWFDTRSGSWLAVAFVAELLTAYLHAVEFYFVAFILLGALTEAMAAGKMRIPSLRFTRSVRMWLVVQVLFGVCVLPLAASALLRGSDAAAPGSAAALLTVGGSLIAGWKASGLLWARVFGTVIFVTLLAIALIERTGRWRTLSIPVAALLVATVIGLAFKPIYKQPVFAANLLPFVVLGAAAAAARTRFALVLALTAVVALAAAAFPLAARQAQPEAYAAAARSVRDGVAAGDVVVVPNVSVFWGIARYAIGPSWGRPLEVLPPPNEEWSRLFGRIASMLGPDAPRRLGLVPDRNFVEHDGVRYVLGTDVAAATRDARHVWLVTRDRYEVDVRLDPRFRPSEVVAPGSFGDGELLVRRYDRVDAP